MEVGYKQDWFCISGTDRMMLDAIKSGIERFCRTLI